jgi:hypothetical protein
MDPTVPQQTTSAKQSKIPQHFLQSKILQILLGAMVLAKLPQL